jgi:hypothetical protein
MEKYLVISCNRAAKPVRLHLDPVIEVDKNAAGKKIAELRQTSDVLLALTSTELRSLAANIERASSEVIALALGSAQREETRFLSRLPF